MGRIKDAVCFDTSEFDFEVEDDLSISREYDDDDYFKDEEDYWSQCAEDALMEAYLFGDC